MLRPLRVIAAAALATLVILAGTSPADAISAARAFDPARLFGTLEFEARSHAALPQWRRVISGINSEIGVYKDCARDPEACPNRGVMAWQTLLKGLKGDDARKQIKAVNRFINQWRYRTDQRNFGRSDYWATPVEFMARSGDCEDYAIAKYVSLRQLGFPPEQLRMVVVQDVLRDLAHAVLAVYVDNEILILDNVTNAVLGHQRLSQYLPYYSVNETARWTHVPASKTQIAAATLLGRNGAPSQGR